MAMKLFEVECEVGECDGLRRLVRVRERERKRERRVDV